MVLESLRRVPDAPNRREALRGIQERKENMPDLARQLGYPKRLFYPAGQADIFPATLPSVDVMVIVDFEPLLLPETKHNSYSRPIYKILEASNGYINFIDLLNHPSFGYAEKANLVADVQSSKEDILEGVSANMSYHGSIKGRGMLVHKDSFSDLLANVSLYGGDLNTMRIGRFGSDYKVQFDVDGMTKTVIFNQTEIDSDFSSKGSDTYRWAQHCFDDYGPGRTALVVKADYNWVAEEVVDAVNPDIIFGESRSIRRIRDKATFECGEYVFNPIDSNTIPHRQRSWGYNPIEYMLIGEKVAGSGQTVLQMQRRNLNDW